MNGRRATGQPGQQHEQCNQRCPTTGDWPASIEGLKIGTNDIVLQSVGTLDRYNPIAGIEAYP